MFYVHLVFLSRLLFICSALSVFIHLFIRATLSIDDDDDYSYIK